MGNSLKYIFENPSVCRKMSLVFENDTNGQTSHCHRLIQVRFHFGNTKVYSVTSELPQCSRDAFRPLRTHQRYWILIQRYFSVFTTSCVLAIRNSSFFEVHHSVVKEHWWVLKDGTRLLLFWVGSLVALYTFVFTQYNICGEEGAHVYGEDIYIYGIHHKSSLK